MTDPFSSNIDGTPAAEDTFDPFGDTAPEDLRSFDGPMLPFPMLSDLDKHLVVMEPIAYDPAREKSKDYQTEGSKTQEVFEVRLTVLGGSPLELANGSVNDKTKEWEPDGTTTVVGSGEHPWPVTWGKFTVRQMAVIGQLKAKFDVSTGQPKDGGFLLGVIRKTPSKQTPKTLTTPDAIDAALIEHFTAMAAGKKSTEPKFAWRFTNYTAEQKALALDWYRNRNS